MHACGMDFSNRQVYRLAEEHIGCSLAEAADGELYTKYLETAGANQGNNLHVIYINTSLRTKVRMFVLRRRWIVRGATHVK